MIPPDDSTYRILVSPAVNTAYFLPETLSNHHIRLGTVSIDLLNPVGAVRSVTREDVRVKFVLSCAQLTPVSSKYISLFQLPETLNESVMGFP